MSFVLFFRGMVAVLAVFAVTIFFLSGSVWTALWQTLVCAVLIQVGYVVAILFMVWRSGDGISRAPLPGRDADAASRPEDPSADAAGKLPVTPFSRRP